MGLALVICLFIFWMQEWRQEAFDIVVGALEQNTVIDAPWIGGAVLGICSKVMQV